MTEPASKRAIKNSFYGFIGWLIPVVLSFVATRILVLELGVKEYGVYSLIQGFIAYLFVFNTARAITKHVAASKSESTESINQIISVTFWVNLFLSVIICILILITSDWLISAVLRIEDQRQEAITGLYVAAFSILFTMLGQPFIAIIHGLQRFDIYSKLLTSTSLVLTIGNIVLAFKGFGVVGLLLWNALMILLLNLFFFLAARKLLPDARIVRTADFSNLLEVFRYGGFNLGYQLLANLLFLFERSWTIRHFGAEGLTYYAVPMTLGIQIHLFITSLSQVVFPMTSEFQSDLEKVKKLYFRATKFCFFLLGFLCSIFILKADDFLSLWINEPFAERSSRILIAHVLSYSLIALIGIAWQTFDGLGKPHFSFLSYAMSFVFSLCSMVLFSNYYGLLGVAIGRLAGTLALFVFTVYFLQTIFRDSKLKKTWFVLFAQIAIILLFLGFLNEMFEIAGFSRGLKSFALSLLLFTFIYFLFILRLITQEEKSLIKMFKR
jgi:O-antigen/teichoic acid export membrane protein